MAFPVADGMKAAIFTRSLWKCMETQVYTIKVHGPLGVWWLLYGFLGALSFLLVLLFMGGGWEGRL